MNLSILNDFCTWWPFWWILPFLLGLALGAALWLKYRARTEELERTVNRYRASTVDLESQLNTNKRQLVEKDVELQKLRSNSQRIIKDLNRSLFAERTEKQNTLKRNSQLTKSQTKSQTQSQTQTQTPKIAKPNPVLKSAVLKSENPKALKDSQPKVNKEGPILNKVAKVSSFAAIPVSSANLSAQKPETKNSDTKVANTNLQIIEGIGPKMEALLKENGVKNWKDLTGKSKKELRKMLNSKGSKYAIIDPTSWPKQAFMAMNSDWSALIRFQKSDGSESKLEKLFNKTQWLDRNNK